MNTRKILPKFKTLSEAKRVVYQLAQKYPEQRPGQVICNLYSVPQKIEEAIYELKTSTEVAMKIIQNQL